MPFPPYQMRIFCLQPLHLAQRRSWLLWLLLYSNSTSRNPQELMVYQLKCWSILLAKLFNLSIRGRCPNSWIVARIVPILKADEMTSPANYRPISTLPIVCKVMERHIACIIMDHLEDVAPISSNQWGFMPGCSTLALLSITNTCLPALDMGYEVCTIFFDVRKAFDSVA